MDTISQKQAEGVVNLIEMFVKFFETRLSLKKTSLSSEQKENWVAVLVGKQLQPLQWYLSGRSIVAIHINPPTASKRVEVEYDSRFHLNFDELLNEALNWFLSADLTLDVFVEQYEGNLALVPPDELYQITQKRNYIDLTRLKDVPSEVKNWRVLDVRDGTQKLYVIRGYCFVSAAYEVAFLENFKRKYYRVATLDNRVISFSVIPPFFKEERLS